MKQPMSGTCVHCGRGVFKHHWLTTHEYEQLHEQFDEYWCISKTEGTFWVVVPEGWEPEFILDTLDKKAPDDPCDDEFMEDIST